MISYRDRLAKELRLDMIYGKNRAAIEEGATYPDGCISRIECCKKLKTEALAKTLNGEWERQRFNHDTGRYEADKDNRAYTGVIVGVRADEEGSRSKERYFSPRDRQNEWDVSEQPLEFWDQYKTDFAPGTHVRIHPLLDWTELDIWEYIHRENIPIVDLYFDNGEGKRYRSLGCEPCTKTVVSDAKDTLQIVEELRSGKFARVAERAGREQDKEDGGGLEELRKNGYM
jgi:sulfate adenylyltransferase subunit 2